LDEGALDDTYTFEVYATRMKKFVDFLKTTPNLRIINLKKNGEYLFITVINSGRYIEWVPLVTFYKEHIKI
jgi:hemerythrin superfamily protein